MKYQELTEDYQEDIIETLVNVELDITALREGHITLERLRDAMLSYASKLSVVIDGMGVLMANRKRYKYIVAWGRQLGSLQYYIDAQVCQAALDNAPETAYAKGQDGWLTADPELRGQLDAQGGK